MNKEHLKQKFEVEKHIIGTESYEINQDIMKGLPEEDLLEKSQAGGYDFDFLNSLSDEFEKAKALPIGTIKKRPNGNFIKTANGWKYHSSHKTSSKKESDISIHEDSKKIAKESGIDEKEFKKLHPDTKKELSRNQETDKQSSFKPRLSESSFNSKTTALNFASKDNPSKGGAFTVKYQDKYYVVSGKRAGEFMKNGASWVRPNGEEISAEKYIQSKKSLSEVASKQSKQSLYDTVNARYNTNFKPGSIEEFEDDDMRTQLTAEDIESIVEDEKNNSK